jgi:ectoine hydroxylase-related dioxygenase (phytanoyl-CoA dioxygenase family)
MKRAIVQIEDEIIAMDVEGDTSYGEEVLLLSHDDDLTEKSSWHQNGYTVQPFLANQIFEQIYTGINGMIKTFVENETGKSLPHFTLEKYHEFCSDNDTHLKVVSNFQKCLPIKDFPVDFKLLDDRISEICGTSVTANHPHQEASQKFCIRIVRPQRKTDNNPPHRDVWLDRLRNAVNIYLPLAGSNLKSSLPIIPGSHLWKESEIERTIAGSKVNDVVFTVPCVVGSVYGLKMIRPQPGINEVMVFSPYLIHGGGCNLNEDVTRVSIEIRFWRKP